MVNDSDMSPEAGTAGINGDFDWPLFLKFLLPTLVGIFLFLVPLHIDGKQTIAIGVITEWVKSLFEGYWLQMVLAVCNLSALGGAYYLLVKPDWKEGSTLYAACHTTPGWLALRVIGTLFGWMLYLQFGPQWILDENTGHTVFMDIGVNILFILTLACFLMPFLTDFGFMEFVGTLLRKPFEFLFRLPGRSAIDATASFVSASTVGVLITIRQYEKGYYSAREALGVAANFSVVSIPFSLVIAKVTGMDSIYLTWYLTVVVVCLVCAFVMMRIPPLSKLAGEYYPPVGKQIHEEDFRGGSLLSWSTQQAMASAKVAPGPLALVKNGWALSVEVLFNIIPPSMALATTSAVLVFNTPVFDVLAYPIQLLLTTLNLPEARAAAPGFIIGFFDQFLPALVAADIESELTRFILSGLSLCQLIFMAEVGVMLLRSSIPVNLWQLFVIFALRTVICFPLLLIAGLLLLAT